MAFTHISGPAISQPFQKLASTAIAVGSLVSWALTGFVSQALVPSTRIVGVALKKVASTESDFAENTTVSVIIPTHRDVFEATVSGTATQANVGEMHDITKTAGGTAQAVDLSGTTYGPVTIVGVKDSATVLVVINGAYQNAEITT